MKTWLITGVSRGLGLALAKAALAQGDQVAGTYRQHKPAIPNADGNLTLIEADLQDAHRADIVVEMALQAYGRIDVLVNNAGFGLLGVFENATDSELQQLFEVDVFAPMRLTRAALPCMRNQGSGHIVNMTSIAGRAPGVGSALYAAAKSAMEGFSAALAQEVRELGIHVTAVAPGQFRTDFLSAVSKQRDTGSQGTYAGVHAALDTLSNIHQMQPGDPQRAAQAILQMVDCAAPPLQLLLGTDAWMRCTQKLQAMQTEMHQWETVTRGTDYAHPVP